MVSQINNALITAGYTKEAAAVGGLHLNPQQRPSIHYSHLQSAHSDPGLCGISGVRVNAGASGIFCQA